MASDELPQLPKAPTTMRRRSVTNNSTATLNSLNSPQSDASREENVPHPTRGGPMRGSVSMHTMDGRMSPGGLGAPRKNSRSEIRLILASGEPVGPTPETHPTGDGARTPSEGISFRRPSGNVPLGRRALIGSSSGARLVIETGKPAGSGKEDAGGITPLDEKYLSGDNTSSSWAVGGPTRRSTAAGGTAASPRFQANGRAWNAPEGSDGGSVGDEDRRNSRLAKVQRWIVKMKVAVAGKGMLIFSMLGLLLSSVGNAIFFKKMTNAMSNYTWFVSQLTTIVYIPIFGVIVIMASRNGTITAAMKRFPKRRFLVMGALDAAGSLLSMVGGAFTAGATQVVLQQAVIPSTLLLTWILLRARYHRIQYLGAVVIIVGVLINKIPDFIHPKPGPQDIVVFNLIFLSAALPMVLSQIYKEVAFRDVELDVNYMQFWVATFQFGVGACLVPFTTLPFLGPQAIAFSEIPTMVVGGSRCLFSGVDGVLSNCGGPGQRLCDSCGTAWIPMTTYICFNLAYNCFTLLVVKHGGATISFLIATLRMPISTMAFYSTWIMGDQAVRPQYADFFGLIVLLSGLLMYRYGGMLQRKERLKSSPHNTSRFVFFSTIVEPEPLFVRVQNLSRSPDEIRSTYYWRLAVASPLQSPHMRRRRLDEPLMGDFYDDYSADDLDSSFHNVDIIDESAEDIVPPPLNSNTTATSSDGGLLQYSGDASGSLGPAASPVVLGRGSRGSKVVPSRPENGESSSLRPVGGERPADFCGGRRSGQEAPNSPDEFSGDCTRVDIHEPATEKGDQPEASVLGRQWEGNPMFPSQHATTAAAEVFSSHVADFAKSQHVAENGDQFPGKENSDETQKDA